MKYNRYSVLILISLVLFCFDYLPFLLIGAICMTIAGIHIIRNEKQYSDDEQTEAESSKKTTRREKGAA